VREAVDNRMSISTTGQIVELAVFCPWIEHLLELERQRGIEGDIKFCVFVCCRF